MPQELQRELLAKFREDSKANKLDEKAFVDMMLLLMNLKRSEQVFAAAQQSRSSTAHSCAG